MTFLAEWGDRSQLTTIILGSREVLCVPKVELERYVPEISELLLSAKHFVRFCLCKLRQF